MIPALAPGVAIAAARRFVAQSLRGEGSESADLDARLLVGHALGLDHAALATCAGRVLGADEIDAIAAVAARRLKGEPVARILGCKEFWGLPLRIGNATLVPRPESETLIETALAALDASAGRELPLRVADLGTGSGALLLALLTELPHARGVGTDICAAALAIARENARPLGLAGRASFAVSDFGAALQGPLDLIVCNPPYVATGEIAALAPEVREHDPLVALDGGADGLAGYRKIAADAPRLLAQGGRLIVELGAGQAGNVQALFVQTGLAICSLAHDLAGIPRALAARVP